MRRGVLPDGLQLARESISVYLAFSADPEVCMSFGHDSILGPFEAGVNTNSVDKVLLLKVKDLRRASIYSPFSAGFSGFAFRPASKRTSIASVRVANIRLKRYFLFGASPAASDSKHFQLALYCGSYSCGRPRALKRRIAIGDLTPFTFPSTLS
jgi:hypothetical protein